MKRVHVAGIFVAVLALPLFNANVALAQTAGGGAPPPAAPPAGGTPTPGTTTTVQGPYVPAAPAPGSVTGGGNTSGSSGSQAHSGNDTDHFDLGHAGGSGNTVHGSDTGSFVLGGATTRYSDASTHTVRRGDTLWGICDSYFKNPYQWPRIWSYNPQIQNPHWIYPGDQVKLKAGVVAAQVTAPTSGQTFVDRRRQVPPDTIFLRNDGFVEDETTSTWGEITGAREDKMFLNDFDEVYIRIADGHEVKLGQELTVFRPRRNVGTANLVQIQGTVRIDEWNANEHIARARITETTDVIERGAFVGPILRKYEVVPPRRNDVDLVASVRTSVQTHVFYGQNAVIFIDHGDADGLKPGNRLFVTRQGDAWHKTQPTRTAAQRIALERDDPAAVENIPRPRDESILPEETVAEIRVITVRQHSAMCLITNASREIELGDIATAKKGY